MALTIALNIFIIIERAIIRVEESQQALSSQQILNDNNLNLKKNMNCMKPLHFGIIAK